jgi:hypothetical protein
MKKRLIVYHLPQFHQIEENDIWWGKGYTEWTAIRNWKPYFKNHILRKPERLGYYDLMDAEILEKQYEIASNYGIEGFCFWTYWFGNGERLLEKPLEHLLVPESKVKYCLAWANHSWFDKSKWRLLKEQKYLGKEDYAKFYKTLSPHFNNSNYIKLNNKLLLSVFMPQDIPDLNLFHDTLNKLAKSDGFDGFYFISDQCTDDIINTNLFDAYAHSPAMFKNRNLFEKILERLIRYYSWTFCGPMKYSYSKMMSGMYDDLSKIPNFIPTIFAGWDTTPRHAKRGVILKDFTIKSFQKHVQEVFALDTQNEFIFIKSWNEWAEGNVLEPDDVFEDELLKVIKKENTSK